MKRILTTLCALAVAMAAAVPVLAAEQTPSREVTTVDGYTGILTLDTASVQVEAAGYGTSSKSVTATRSYPNLSDADTAFVPKTIEDSGRTLSLTDVQWQETGGSYHATATYTGTATNKYVTGYIVTANYTGEVSKTTSDTVVYTAIFSGEEIPDEIGESETEQPVTTLNFDSLKYPLMIGGAVLVLTAGGVFVFKKVKEKR